MTHNQEKNQKTKIELEITKVIQLADKDPG